MVRIKISELYPITRERFIDELTAREMNMIAGGINGYIEDDAPTQEDVSNIIKSINDEIQKMSININGKTYNFRNAFEY